MRPGIFLGALLMPVAATAATVGEEDAMTINRLNATDFEVISGSFTDVSEYFWCGAATYVIRRKGGSDGTLITLKRPLGPSLSAPGRKGVVFTTAPEAASGAERLTLTMEVPGAALKAVRARSYCRDAFTRSTK